VASLTTQLKKAYRTQYHRTFTPLVQERIGQVIEGALAAIAPVAFTPGAVVIRAPRINVVAPAPGTLQRALFPPQCMNVGVTLVDVEEFVDV
jgi:hypothetical protein